MHPRGPAPEAQIDIVQRDGLVLHPQSPDLLGIDVESGKISAGSSPTIWEAISMKRQPGPFMTIIFACAAVARRGHGCDRPGLGAAKPPFAIVALGDSLSAGYGLPAEPPSLPCSRGP